MPQVYFNLPAEDLAVVDQLATAHDVARAEVLRELVHVALEARSTSEIVGLRLPEPPSASSETTGPFLIRDVDAWLRVIMAGQPADPDRRYVLRVHPATRAAITEAAVRQMGVDTLMHRTDQLGTLQAQYGQARLVVNMHLAPGEWELHEYGEYGQLLNHGRLGYPVEDQS